MEFDKFLNFLFFSFELCFSLVYLVIFEWL